MTNETLKESLKQAAVEFARIEAEYLKAKIRFDNLFNAAVESRNGDEAGTKAQVLALGETDHTRPLTQRILTVLPKDFRPLSIKQIAALVGSTAKIVSATCSNLQRNGKVESAGRGVWRLSQR